MMKIRGVLSWLSGLVFLLFVTEMMAGGSGETIVISGIGIRRILLVLTAFVFSALLATRILQREYVYNSDRWKAGLIACLMIVIWVCLLPHWYGQGIGMALKDAGPFIGAGIIVALFDDDVLRFSWKYVRTYLFFLLLAFALFHISLYFIGLQNPQAKFVTSNSLQEIFDPYFLKNGNKFVFIGYDHLGPRVYFGSSFLMLIGLYFSFFYNRHWHNLQKLGLAFVFFAGLVLTETRSLILGALIFLSIVYWVKRRKHVAISKSIHVWLLIGLPFVATLFLLPLIASGSVTSIFLDRVSTDNIKLQQMYGLFQGIAQSPFFGAGFGAHAPYVRNPDMPYAYELSVLALYMKVGLIGVIALIHTLFLYIRSINPGTTRPAQGIGGIYALYCAIIGASFFNPFLFGFFGTFFIIIIFLEANYIQMPIDEN